MVELGVNIDHVATIREARKTYEPDPVWAASAAELGGADSITVHLREDRRHIQDRDLRVLKETVAVKLNLEIACSKEMIEIACNTSPHQASLVPEKREEVTTEGGLDVIGNSEHVKEAISRLQDAGVFVSLFLDPDVSQIEAAAEIGADAVELHTGQYAIAAHSYTNASPSRDPTKAKQELAALVAAGAKIRELNMRLHAGHGLNYFNVLPVAEIQDMHELNIGHAIVARSVFVGLQTAVRQMKDILTNV